RRQCPHQIVCEAAAGMPTANSAHHLRTIFFLRIRSCRLNFSEFFAPKGNLIPYADFGKIILIELRLDIRRGIAALVCQYVRHMHSSESGKVAIFARAWGV